MLSRQFCLTSKAAFDIQALLQSGQGKNEHGWWELKSAACSATQQFNSSCNAFALHLGSAYSLERTEVILRVLRGISPSLQANSVTVNEIRERPLLCRLPFDAAGLQTVPDSDLKIPQIFRVPFNAGGRHGQAACANKSIIQVQLSLFLIMDHAIKTQACRGVEVYSLMIWYLVCSQNRSGRSGGKVR
jgi:hypothetical protein